MITVQHEIKKTIEDIYTRYASLIHTRCLRIVHTEDDAWDITQDVFIKLLKSYTSIKNKQALLSWLLQTSTNMAISHWRKKKGVAYDDTSNAAVDQNSESNETAMLDRTIIHKVLQSWDKKTVALVIYTYVDGYTQAEIASITGMGQSTIRKYLTRFKRKTKEWKIFQDEHK